ncbi:hypothetical protein ACNOYE_16975 [Nannocystaceae bacterium ST9]
MKKFLLAALLSLPLLSVSACDGTGGGFTIPPKVLAPGGAYVTYVQSTDCEGCSALKRGDLIQTIDGKEAKSAAAIKELNIIDGKPHEVAFKRWSKGDFVDQKITITAKPNNTLTPVVDAPPFWTVDAEKLNAAPEGWARRRLFGHASPQLLLVNIDGGLINGRDLYGKKRLMVFFDWASQDDQRNGTVALKILQQAQPELNAKGVELMFVQLMHPSERPKPPMNDTDLRAFFTNNQATEKEGGPLPPPPMYRYPNKTEDNPSQTLGLEGAFNYLENIGEAPNVFILDEFGVIRWHSAGPIPGDSGEPDMVKVMVTAVEFARDQL